MVRALAPILAAAIGLPLAAMPQAAGGDAAKPGSERAREPAPVAPASLPSGATLPIELAPEKVRSEDFIARSRAFERALNCAGCKGTGTKVTRVRQTGGTLGSTTPVHELREKCQDCKGDGCRRDLSRVGPGLDMLVELMGAYGTQSKVAAKELQRARQLLDRVAAAPAVADELTAQDRNAIASGQRLPVGATVTVAGTLGKHVVLPGGQRLLAVGTGPQSAVLLRNLELAAAPASGAVLVGGRVAGAVGNVEWEWGQVLVLDRGFVIASKPAPEAPAAAPEGAPESPSSPPAASPSPGGSTRSTSASPIP
jgi:hypothetical protein